MSHKIPYLVVVISTRNREQVFKETYKQWKKFMPKNSQLLVVDDGSDIPYHKADHRFNHNVGIAKTKNKSIELAYLTHSDNIFLVDDDIYPITKDWYKPYVDSGQNHLCMIFDKFADGKTNGNKLIKQEKGLSYYENPCGVLLYFRRKVFNMVGGMDTAYGMWGYEHVSFSRRIFNAGLTDHPFIDVTDSHKLFYAHDYHKSVERSVSLQTRIHQININKERFEQDKDSKEMLEFTEGKNVIITTYFTKQIDPQRGIKWEPNITDISALAESCYRNKQNLIVLHDELYNIPHHGVLYSGYVKFVHVHTNENPYFQRWRSILKYLKENHFNNVFCVDATDVELIKLPWSEMVSGKLYTGYESGTVSNHWLYKHHNVGVCRQLFTTYKNHHLLNAGIVGGDLRVLTGFLEKLMWAYDRNEGNVGSTDMGLFNLIMHALFAGVAESGKMVVSQFKKFEQFSEEQIKSGDVPWFKHK